jgi:hypothetical protein
VGFTLIALAGGLAAAGTALCLWALYQYAVVVVGMPLASLLVGLLLLLASVLFLIDRAQTDRRNTEEAKQRFREAAEQLEIAAWVRHDPYGALALSFIAGLVLANSSFSRDELASLLVRLVAKPSR